MNTRLPLAVLFVFLVPVVAAWAKPQAKPAEVKSAGEEFTLKNLAGTYRIVASEKHGKATLPEEYAGMTVTITDDKIVTLNKDNAQVHAGSYRLDPEKKPTAIHIISTMPESEGAKAFGLIEMNGDTVKLIYMLPTGKIAPTEFKTRQGQIMITLQREEKKEAEVKSEKEPGGLMP